MRTMRNTRGRYDKSVNQPGKLKTKVVGHRRQERETNPKKLRERARTLQEHVDRVNPYPKPRGFVYKARTWKDYETWRKQQDNPRLW